MRCALHCSAMCTTYDYIAESDSEFSGNYCLPVLPTRSAPPAYLFRDGQLTFHKAYQSRQPFTFIDTGLYEGGRHDWYGVHTDRDLVWARRLNLVLQRHNIQRGDQAAPKQSVGSSSL